MVMLQNTKPKITKPKILKVKKIWSKFEFLWKARDKLLDSHEQKIVKVTNPNVCKTKFSATWWNANETEKLCTIKNNLF